MKECLGVPRLKCSRVACSALAGLVRASGCGTAGSLLRRASWLLASTRPCLRRAAASPAHAYHVGNHHFHTSTNSPLKINVAPKAMRHVKGSFRNRKQSTSVTTMLALSIVATTATLPSFMAR